MKMMEVRCCCQPQKLMGYLPVMEESRPYAVFRWVERQGYAWNAAETPTQFKCVTLPVEMIQLGNGMQYLALKAECKTLKELREIPGFVEADNGQ